MIACVGPGFSSANHTINTLRYSDRLKEKTNQINNNNLMHQKYIINKKEPKCEPEYQSERS
jgi:hypothetical protein